MPLDLSAAGRVDRAAKGIASDAVVAIGLIAGQDADEAIDVADKVFELVGKFRAELLTAINRDKFPGVSDPFDGFRVVATLQAGGV